MYIIFLGLLGLPAVIVTLRGQICVLQTLAEAPTDIKGKIRTVFLILAVTSIGVYIYLLVFFQELSVQQSCMGAACAQSGVGLTMYTPIAWLSYYITTSIAKHYFNGKDLPLLATPNFSFKRDA